MRGVNEWGWRFISMMMIVLCVWYRGGQNSGSNEHRVRESWERRKYLRQKIRKEEKKVHHYERVHDNDDDAK